MTTTDFRLDDNGIPVYIPYPSIYSALQNWPFSIPLWAVIGGMIATLIIGAIGGLYPAMRAAQLAPTEALVSM